MFHFFLNSKKILVFFIILSLLLIIFSTTCIGIRNYEQLDFVTGLVTANILNVRAGPSTNYRIISQVYKNEYIRVFAKIGAWYVIQTENDYIGAVSKEYVKPIYPTDTSNSEDNKEKNSEKTTQGLTKDEEETLNLINNEREKQGLEKLIVDDEVQNVARVKANDMVNGGYFSHTSPTYGTPFEMLKSYGIAYKAAGENIAGNSQNSGAVNAWMNSEGHKANILNNSYNYTGLAVVSSPKYGKIYVQIFIGK